MTQPENPNNRQGGGQRSATELAQLESIMSTVVNDQPDEKVEAEFQADFQPVAGS